VDVSEGECIVTRQVSADGRSRAFINGTPLPGKVLRAAGELLVDIHGQHAHQSLLRRDVQRALVDEQAGTHRALAAVRAACDEWRDVTEALERLQASDPDGRAREADYLEHQVREIEALQITTSELAGLEAEHTRLAHLSEIIGGSARSLALLEEGEPGARTAVARAARELRNLLSLEPRFEAIVGLLEGAAIHLDEASAALERHAGSLSSDPERLHAIEARLSALHEVARKHRVSVAELPGRLEELSQRLAAIGGISARISDLEAAQALALATYREAAEALRALRLRAIPEMARKITANMQVLGMPGGELGIELSDTEDSRPTPSGIDRVEFTVSTNPGQPPHPLSKVASGGELSRISLAVQVLATGSKGIPTLIFDEVDVGIGGAVAEIVGTQLRRLGEQRQVLCVTHLPQVACLGHHHLKVIKEVRGEITRTQVARLAARERTEEIARMLGGRVVSEQALRHAREMLDGRRAGRGMTSSL
jgi:DNA repair protein RecN (Recombination protein N)